MEAHERQPRYMPKCVSVKISLAILSVLLGVMGFAVFGCVLHNWNAGNDLNVLPEEVPFLNKIYQQFYQNLANFSLYSCIWSYWCNHCCNFSSFTRELQIWRLG